MEKKLFALVLIIWTLHHLVWEMETGSLQLYKYSYEKLCWTSMNDFKNISSPFRRFWKIGDKIQCGSMCNGYTDCRSFAYLAESSRCLLFSATCENKTAQCWEKPWDYADKFD